MGPKACIFVQTGDVERQTDKRIIKCGVHSLELYNNMRKCGLSVDNIIDALIVDVNGRVLG